MAQKKGSVRKTMAQKTAKKAASPGTPLPSGGKKVTPKDKKAVDEMKKVLDDQREVVVRAAVQYEQAKTIHNQQVAKLLQLDGELTEKVKSMLDKYELDPETKNYSYNFDKGTFTEVEPQQPPSAPKE